MGTVQSHRHSVHGALLPPGGRDGVVGCPPPGLAGAWHMVVLLRACLLVFCPCKRKEDTALQGQPRSGLVPGPHRQPCPGRIKSPFPLHPYNPVSSSRCEPNAISSRKSSWIASHLSHSGPRTCLFLNYSASFTPPHFTVGSIIHS